MSETRKTQKPGKTRKESQLNLIFVVLSIETRKNTEFMEGTEKAGAKFILVPTFTRGNGENGWWFFINAIYHWT